MLLAQIKQIIQSQQQKLVDHLNTAVIKNENFKLTYRLIVTYYLLSFCLLYCFNDQPICVVKIELFNIGFKHEL